MADNPQGNVQNDDVTPSIPVLRLPSETTVLKLKFGTLSGEKTFTFNYGDATADRADVRALMQAMIDNGSIFKYPPLVASEAWVEQKTVTPFSLG